MGGYIKTTVCDFTEVRIRIPQKKINKHYWSYRFLETKDADYFSQKLKEIEGAIFKLENVRSIVEQIKLRSNNIH